MARSLQTVQTIENTTEHYLHHEEGFATQIKMKQQVQSLVEVISVIGNPFEDVCPQLLILNSRDCADESVISTVRSIECLGKMQYLKYIADVINSGKASIHDTIDQKRKKGWWRGRRERIEKGSRERIKIERKETKGN